MNYSDFKEYLARFLWRDGDPVFEGDLDHLIDMANSRLNRDLRVDDMIVTKEADLSGQSLEVPHDFLEMRSMTAPDGGILGYVTPQRMNRFQLNTPYSLSPYYTKTGRYFHFHSPASYDRPIVVTMSYYAKVPNFKYYDESWLVDNYLDLYTYAVLRHTGMYLKDDQRVPIWQAEYAEALTSANDADARQRYAGSPLNPPLPGVVA